MRPETDSRSIKFTHEGSGLTQLYAATEGRRHRRSDIMM